MMEKKNYKKEKKRKNIMMELGKEIAIIEW